MADKKTTIVCFVCRKEIKEVVIDHKIYCEIAYDFCDSCVKLMVYDFERQIRGLPARKLSDLSKPKKLRLEEEDGS